MATLENGSAFSDNESLTYAEAFPPLASGHTGGPKARPSDPTSLIKRIPASTVTKIFHVPLEERRYKSNESSAFGCESQQASAIRDIMAKTGCNIETSQSKDLSLTIIVSGKPSSVKEAEKMICTDLLTKYTARITIPKQHHRVILGKQGSKLHQIEESTNTKIAIPRGDESSDIIRITGNKEGVEIAQHQIQTLSDELAKKAKEILDIPHDYHPFISGAKNESVNKLMQETGTRIHIPPYSVHKSDITITGEKEGVAKAKACILKLYDEAKKNYSTVSVEVRKSQHKYIIGMKGQGVQEILHTTGVIVDVPSSNSSESTITLRGPQDKLGEALNLVYSKANSMTTVEVEAPSWLHRFIIGQNGQNIKDITQDLPHVMVTFPKDTDKIVIEGPPDEVQCARESFERFTTKLKATMVYAEVHVDQKFHPHVIGKRGANVQKIKKDTCTSISIPGDTQNSDVIRIEGDPKGVAAAKKAIMELAAKLENESNKSLQIEQKWHKLIIGANGENMKALHDRYPGVHVAFPEPGRRSNIVTLRGPKDKVDECSAYLNKLAKEISESNYKVEVKIFKKYHGSVIGKGGSTLKKIREDTNTKIEMPKEEMDSDVIVITGRKEDAEKAKRMLLEIEKQMASIVDLTVKISHKQHNAIIGPRGKLIRSVMEECGGVHIKFPPTEDTTNDTVVIHGPKEDATRAKEKLLKIAADHAVENYTIEIKCKPEYHRFLIGKGGGKIRKIRDQFDARVLFPQKESGDDIDVITIIGRKENVEKTKEHMEQLIKDLSNVVQEEMTVDPKHHRHFIQRRGQLIHEISDENGGIIISFPRSGSGSDKVMLKGAVQCVAGAKMAIQEVIDDLDSQVTIECVIPQKHHRDVMGSRGTNVQTVTQEHNVTIKFPDREARKASSPASDNSDTKVNGDDNEEPDAEAKTETPPPGIPNPKDIIHISGRAENCEAAKKALLDLVPVKVLVNVPYEFHRYIIGANGQEVRKMAEKYSIVIEVPHPSSQEDVITLLGPAHHCEEGKQALELKVQELEAKKEERELRSYTEVLEVDPKYHPNIIGRRGATINKIRKDHDVRIQLPEKDSSNASEITIIGYEHNVHAAMEALLKIVRELEDQISEDIEIDHRVHSRLIGGKGRAIAKVMERFNVVIRFPHDKKGDTVTITGLEENVEDAKEHLLMLAEDYMQDVIERQEEEDLLSQYTRRPTHQGTTESSSSSNGFVVKGAPWSSTSSEEFPAISSSAAVPSKTPIWGPSTGPKIPKGM